MKEWHARLRVGGVSVVVIIMSCSISKDCDTMCASMIPSRLSMMSPFTLSLTCLELFFLLNLAFFQIKVVSYPFYLEQCCLN